MENFAAALPHLRSMHLGHPYCFNFCGSAVASLMSISVHRLDLAALETHISTLEIVRDSQQLLDGGTGREKAKCKVLVFSVGNFSTTLCKEDIKTLGIGFKAIFPCLRQIRYIGKKWMVISASFSCKGLSSSGENLLSSALTHLSLDLSTSSCRTTLFTWCLPHLENIIKPLEESTYRPHRD